MLKQQISEEGSTIPHSSMNAMIKFIEQGHEESEIRVNQIELSFQRSIATIPFEETHLSAEIHGSMKNMVEAAQIKDEAKPIEIIEEGNLTSEEEPSSSQDQSQIVKKQIQFHYGERESVIEQEKSDIIQLKDPQSNQPQVMIEVSDEIIKEEVTKTKCQKNNKKKSNKCLVCKSSGRNGEMKKCCRCHLYVHFVCLQVQESAKKSHYVCQRCEFKKNNKNIKIEVVDLQSEDNSPPPLTNSRINIQKLIGSQRRLNKFDKRSQQLLEFQQKYPNLIDGENILYPIDDRLLILYSELTQVDEKRRIDPSEHPIVPSCWLGDFLEIENWLVTFRSTLAKNFTSFTLPYLNTKEYLFTSMKQKGQDPAFRNLLCTILRLFLSDVLQNPRKENMRMLSESNFFQLLGELNEHGDISDQFLTAVAPEVIKHLTMVPSFLNTLSSVVIPQTYDCGDKIAMIIELLKALNETNSFRLLATRKTESIQELVDLKGKLVNKIKAVEAGRLQNKQKISGYDNFQQIQKESKKDGKSKSKKKLQQLQKEDASSEIQLVKAKQQLQECLRSLQFATSEVLFLGRDRNGSEYFFPRYDSFRVYVRYRRYFLDSNPQYGIYESQERILEIARTLSSKGINEKRLSHNIHILNKLKLFGDKKEEPLQIIPCDQLQIQNYFIDLTAVVGFLMEIQRQYYIFLRERGYEWTRQEIRETKLQYIHKQQNLNKIAEEINRFQQNFHIVDHIESETKGERSKKKISMRIWGSAPDKIKRCWTEYLLKQKTPHSLWVALYILNIHLNRFINRKIQQQSQQRRKNQKSNKQNQKNDKEDFERQLNDKQLLEKSEEQHEKNLCFQQNLINQENKEDKKHSRNSKKEKNTYKMDVEKSSYQAQPEKVNQKISSDLKSTKLKKRPKQDRSKQLARKNKKVKKQNQNQNESQNKTQEQISALSKKQKQEDQKILKKHENKIKNEIPKESTVNNTNSFKQLEVAQHLSSSNLVNKRPQLTLTNPNNMIQQKQYEEIITPIIKKQRQNVGQKTCGACGQKEPKTFIECSNCNKYYHLKCSGLNRRPRNQWTCEPCSSANNGTRTTRSKS